MLVHITTELGVDPTAVPWIDGELVRRGAWDAHFTDDGNITVAVIARSRADAATRVEKLLAQVLGPDADAALSRDRPLV